MPERRDASFSKNKRRWISWSTPEGRRALERFATSQEKWDARLIGSALQLERDPFYRHGFANGWIFADQVGREAPLAFLWAGFDEWEVQRRRRPIGLFGLRLHPEASVRPEFAPTSKELESGMDLVARFLRSRAMTDAVGPVQLGFQRDSNWGVRPENAVDAGLLQACRSLGMASEKVGRRIRLSIRQILSSPGFLADVELARDGGKVALRPLAFRPLWRGLGLALDPLRRVEPSEWARLANLAQDSVWDAGFAEAVGSSPAEWIEVARHAGAHSFRKWSRWIEVAGEIAGFVLAWEQGDTVRVRRIFLDDRYRDFHLAPFALKAIADRAIAERKAFLEIGPVPAGLGAWGDLLSGFIGESSTAVLADEAVELFTIDV